MAYDVIPNYGVAIIILTLVMKFVLFPLGMKQIKSMQHMQALQPKIKDIQKKYKGNKQKAQEETMKLYKEAGVNPWVAASRPGAVPVPDRHVRRAQGAGRARQENDPVTASRSRTTISRPTARLFAIVVTHEGRASWG